MSEALVLTEAETRLIAEMRAVEAAKKATAARRLKMLKLAYEYEAFLQETQDTASYSSFVHDFGGDDSGDTYNAVQIIRSSVTSGVML